MVTDFVTGEQRKEMLSNFNNNMDTNTYKDELAKEAKHYTASNIFKHIRRNSGSLSLPAKTFNRQNSFQHASSGSNKIGKASSVSSDKHPNT